MRQLTFDDPPAQRHSRTSREAAEAIREHAPSIRERVYLYVMAHGPVTDQAIAIGLDLSENTVRPRRVELMAEGFIRADAEEGKTLSGRAANRWVTCEPF